MGPRFLKVYVRASIDACEGRDVKGLYSKARAEIQGFTGVSDPYEEPLSPPTWSWTPRQETPADSAARLVEYVEQRLGLGPSASGPERLERQH